MVGAGLMNFGQAKIFVTLHSSEEDALWIRDPLLMPRLVSPTVTPYLVHKNTLNLPYAKLSRNGIFPSDLNQNRRHAC